MIIEAIVAAVAVAAGAAWGMRTRRSKAERTTLRPAQLETQSGIRTGSVLLIAGESVVLGDASTLNEGDLRICVYRLVDGGERYFVTLGSQESDWVLAERSEGVPNGAVASRFSLNGHSFQLHTRGHARVTGDGPAAPLTEGVAPFVWLEAATRVLLVVDGAERLTLVGQRLDPHMVERLR